MRKVLQALGLFALIPLGIASASMFDSQSQVRAYVKAIAVSKEIKVKFIQADEDKQQLVLNVCPSELESEQGDLVNSDVAKKLRTAMRMGSPLTITYSSLFDRCIQSVSL